jgi:hypothetical protein
MGRRMNEPHPSWQFPRLYAAPEGGAWVTDKKLPTYVPARPDEVFEAERATFEAIVVGRPRSRTGRQ